VRRCVRAMDGGYPGLLEGRTRRTYHILAFSQGDIVLDPAGHFPMGFITTEHRQDTGSIGHQDLLSRSDRGGNGFIRTCQFGRISLVGIISRQDEFMSLAQFNLVNPVLEESRTNLRTFGIQQD
jgi:hypothetical protein